MRAAFLTLLLLGCDNGEPPKAPSPKLVEAPKPAKANKDVLAEKILAAIVADDFEQLRPLFRVPGVDRKTTDELAEVNSDCIRRVRSKLEELSVDPKALKIVRVEGEAGMQVEMYDVFLEANGKRLKTHFSTNGTGHLLGVANWIVPDDVSNN